MTDHDRSFTPSGPEDGAETIAIETVAFVTVPIELETELALAHALEADRAGIADADDANFDSSDLGALDSTATATASSESQPDSDSDSGPSLADGEKRGWVESVAAAAPLSNRELSDALASTRAALEARLDKLSSQFDREVRAEATRERVVDRLHAELQEYKNDLLLKVLRPVFVDLIQLHDDIGKMAGSLPTSAGADSSAQQAIDILQSVQQGIEDTLYRQGVEPFPNEAQPGSAFDARRQRAVATVPSDDPELAKKVAARLRKGFQAGDKVIRPEIVSVYSLGRKE